MHLQEDPFKEESTSSYNLFKNIEALQFKEVFIIKKSL